MRSVVGARAGQWAGRLAGLALAATVWAAPQMVWAAEGSRYDAALWVWLASIGATAGITVAGLLIAAWFHRKRRRAADGNG